MTPPPPDWLSEAKPFDPDAYLREKQAAPKWWEAPEVQSASGKWSDAPEWNTPPTAQERAAAGSWLADAKPVQEQPGLLRRALAWATTPPAAMRPILEQQAATRGGAPLGLTKDSGDLAAGAHALVSGIPGYIPNAQSDEAAARMGRFRSEHPVLGIALPMAGGLSKPGFLPVQRAVPAAAPLAAAQAAPQAVAEAPAAANAYEAAARSNKVAELVKAIDANAGVHLGVDPRDQRFAEALTSLPEKWWDGMGQVAKINKPSQTTIDQTVEFFRDRAAQAGRAAQDVPAAAPVPASVPVPATQATAPFTLGTQLQEAGGKLSNMPRTPWSPLDFIVGAHGWHAGGTLRAAAEAAAMKAVRNYGPGVAGAVLNGAGKAVDAIPPQLLVGAVQAARGAASSTRPEEDWLDAYLREKQAQAAR